MLSSNLRHKSCSSRASSASLTDDDDAITPVDMDITLVIVPTANAAAPTPKPAVFSSPSPSDSSSSLYETARLWRRMLALQRRYHCYRSARISAALENERVQAVVPSRACLDLLNDGIASQLLPDEARREVAALVAGRLSEVALEEEEHAGVFGSSVAYVVDEDVEYAADVETDTDERPGLAGAHNALLATSTYHIRSSLRQRRRQVWRRRC